MPFGVTPLAESDPELYDLIKQEHHRQKSGLELIASENFASRAVLEALGSCLTNKYSEGQVGQRYYGGNEIIDKVESLCIKRALEAFHLDPNEWGVNVQPYSGSIANFAAYTAVLNPHDRLMGLDLPSGGHLTHGYQTSKKKISSTSVYFESLPYQVNKTGYIDYDKLEETATIFRPKLLICGGSAYPREWDYARFRKIADINGSYLLCDMAHISGLVAGKQAVSPFDYCDLVTTTTHKTLRGPRAGLIFFKKGFKKDAQGKPTTEKYDLEARVNFAVFPSIQGGPHDNAIGSIATALKEASSPEFHEYAANVKKNAAFFAKELINRGFTLSTGGTDNHLILWDLRPAGLTGNKFEKICERVEISVNKNSIYGDTSALVPGGVRIGTSSLTTRGFTEQDFVKVVDFLERALKLALELQKNASNIALFVANVEKSPEVAQLRKEVQEFASQFPMPGLDV